MPCSSSTVQAGTDQQNWKCQTTSPCSNSRPIRQNSTRWKTFGPTCAPTSWQSLCLNPTMRSSTNAAMPGISSQRTNRQSHQLHHVIGPKQSINRAVGIRGVNRPLPSGYKKHAGDPTKAILSATRPLTTIERSYLQTFPKSFKFEGTKTNLEQMIGNAVPVNLATFVAKGILEYCKNGEIKEPKQYNLFSNIEQCKMPNKALHLDDNSAISHYRQ